MARIHRKDPQEVRTVRAGDVLNFTLPRGVVDLKTLRLWASATIVGGAANQRALPRDVETLIDTLTVWVGDQMVQHTPHYNLVARAMLDYLDEDAANGRALLANSMYIQSGLNDAAFNTQAMPICMSEWLGFLGTDQMFDTRRAPVRFEIALAPNAVLMSSATTATYELADAHITVVCDPQGELWETAKAPTQMEFDNWRTIMQDSTGYAQDTQLNVRTRELDLLLGTFIPLNYRSIPITTTSLIGTSPYFTRGTVGLPADLRWNFVIDHVPQISDAATVPQAFEYARTVLGDGGIQQANIQQRNGTFVQRTLAQLSQTNWLAVLDVGGRDMTERDGDVVFSTTATAPGNTPVMTLLAARCRSLLAWDADARSAAHNGEKGAWRFTA